MTRRSRSRSRARSGGGLTRRVAIGIVLLAAISVAGASVVSSYAFTSIEGGRGANVDVAGDADGLLGIDLADSVAIGGDDDELPDCTVTGDTVIVTEKVDGGIDTEYGVVVTSGSRVIGTINAGGCIVVESGGRVSGDAIAGGNVSVRSGARIDGDVKAGGAVTLNSGSRIDGDVTVTDEDLVNLAPGAKIQGEIIVDGESGGGGSNTSVFLVEVTNNLAQEAKVTVSLTDPADGTLFAGSQSGSSIQVWLDPGEDVTVDIDPSSSVGSQIQLQIVGETQDGGTVVSMSRSVDTVQS